MIVEPGTLQDSTEPVMVGVEDPSAVAGVEGDEGHDRMVDHESVNDL